MENKTISNKGLIGQDRYSACPEPEIQPGTGWPHQGPVLLVIILTLPFRQSDAYSWGGVWKVQNGKYINHLIPTSQRWWQVNYWWRLPWWLRR